ncbi:MAG: hypothetical protein H6600_04845 [Flavobacteriales bacterium]|nr:hypothetical protein [Flavobacteriales bacterium]MCB9197764.1 hypothetical protein [Flavobacteriales bacterium]
MKRTLLLSFLLIILGLISFRMNPVMPEYLNLVDDDFSSNPPPTTTGAPGENSCTDCHAGSTLPAAGVVTFSFSGVNDMYVIGQSYYITIGKSGSSKTGFEMTSLDDNDQAAGSFTAGTNSQIVSFNGRNYIRQSASSGINSWTFTWNAPASPSGDITFYYALNAANGDNNSQGDQIYLGSNTITNDIAGEVEESSPEANVINMTTELGKLSVNLSIQRESDIYFTAQNLEGKQLDFHHFGEMMKGQHILYIDLDEKYSGGLYLFTIFVNNKPYTTKIAFHK